MADTTEEMASASSSTGMTTSGTAAESRRPVPAAVPLGIAAVWVAAAWAVGTLGDVGRLLVRLPPLYARWEPSIGWGTLLATAVGIAVVAGLPAVTERARWSVALVASWASAAVFAVALAAADGFDAVTAPLTHRAEYRSVFDTIAADGVGDFTSTFTERLGDYPTHVRGHPVGATLAVWLPEHLGLHGAGWTAALVIAAGTSTVVSLGVAARRLAGEDLARRALPFVAIGPAAVWVATSVDALFAGVVAATIALAVLATDDEGRPVLAALAGVTACLALHLTYGAVLMLLPALAVFVVRRRWGLLAWAAGGAAVVVGAFVAGGFWWFDGLAATREEYRAGAGGYRPYWYFAALANPAALVIALGPAVVVAVCRLRRRGLGIVVGAAAVGIAIADLSGLSKGEVERIWLPFVPVLALAAVALAHRRRWWLGAQVAAALVLQTILETPW